MRFFVMLQKERLTSYSRKNMQDRIETLAKTFFDMLWVPYSELTVTPETDTIFRVSLQSDDSHLLIGPHGKNLDTITHLMKVLAAKQDEGFVNLHVEINDYLAKKDEKLIWFIQSKIDYVNSSGKEIILPFLTAYERKKVHSYVSENGWDVYTQSQWEGRDRRMHLIKKSTKMTIDIDGDDI